MMDADGKILFLEPSAVLSLRGTGKLRQGTDKSGAAFRDIEGIDERVWEHLIYCAQMWRMIQLYGLPAALERMRGVQPDPRAAAMVSEAAELQDKYGDFELGDL